MAELRRSKWLMQHFVVEADTPRCGGNLSGENFEQAGFTGARRTHQCHHLAWIDAQGDVIQDAQSIAECRLTF